MTKVLDGEDGRGEDPEGMCVCSSVTGVGPCASLSLCKWFCAIGPCYFLLNVLKEHCQCQEWETYSPLLVQLLSIAHSCSQRSDYFLFWTEVPYSPCLVKLTCQGQRQAKLGNTVLWLLKLLWVTWRRMTLTFALGVWPLMEPFINATTKVNILRKWKLKWKWKTIKDKPEIGLQYKDSSDNSPSVSFCLYQVILS